MSGRKTKKEEVLSHVGGSKVRPASSLSLDTLTALFRLLGDETRLRILSLLSDNELAVGELQKILGLGQSTLSTHLSLLREQELVASRKEGQKVYYRIPADLLIGAHGPILTSAFSSAQLAKWHEKDQRILNEVLHEREETSLDFFNQLSNQNIPSPGQTWDALALGLFKLLRNKDVADLGCGNGRLSLLFAKNGNQVTGVDNSPEQLKLALHKSSADKKNLKWVQAPMEKTGLNDNAFDIALLSQSLHHAVKPQQAISEAFRILRKGGLLLVLDLVAHNEDWMRKKFGDFWLGFTLSDMENWVREAGFKQQDSEITKSGNDNPNIEGFVLLAIKE